jgi:diacylglycerol kinase family enzyme
MSNPAFIINPLSHSVAKYGSDLKRSGVTTMANCYLLNSFDTLPSAVADTLAAKCKHVFIEGGDGTIHGVLSMFLAQQPDVDKLPNFTLLPGGMTNLVASHVGLKRPSRKKLVALIKRPETQTTAKLPLLAAKASDSENTHYGFLLSTGALPAATRYCVEHVHSQGVSGSAAVRKTLLKVLFSRGIEREIILRPTPLSLDLGFEKVDGDHVVMVATTLPRLMIGLKPFWGIENGRIMLTHANKNTRHIKRNIARMMMPGQSARSSAKLMRDGFRSWNVDEAVMQLSGEIVLDGEFLPHTDSPISLFATKPLRFIK